MNNENQFNVSEMSDEAIRELFKIAAAESGMQHVKIQEQSKSLPEMLGKLNRRIGNILLFLSNRDLLRDMADWLQAYERRCNAMFAKMSPEETRAFGNELQEYINGALRKEGFEVDVQPLEAGAPPFMGDPVEG